jgi:hypothetical protein
MKIYPRNPKSRIYANKVLLDYLILQFRNEIDEQILKELARYEYKEKK